MAVSVFEIAATERARQAYECLRATDHGVEARVKAAARQLLMIWPDDLPDDVESSLDLVMNELLPALETQDKASMEAASQALAMYAARVFAS